MYGAVRKTVAAVNDDEDVPKSLDMAILCLQTPSSAFDSRLNALRFLLAHSQGASSDIDESTREKLQKLIFDTLLSIIMGDDRTSDLRNRQLARTECFFMLATVLKSKTLFGDTEAKLQISELLKKNAPDSAVANNIGGSIAIDKSKNRPMSSDIDGNNRAGMQGKVDLSSSSASTSRDTSSIPHNNPEYHVPSDTNGNGVEASGTIQSRTATSRRRKKMLLYEALKSKYATTKVAYMREQKGKKPRQSVIFGSDYDHENFVPGSDPTNWAEQDKRLGYRKERMWFPFKVGLNNNIIPAPREVTNPHALQPDKIVQEYLQMRALMSYVGDMIMIPTAGAAPIPGKPRGSGKTGVPSPLEKGRYDAAVREAVQMWTPLLGSNMPPWARKFLVDLKPPSDITPEPPLPPSTVLRPPVPKTPSTASRRLDGVHDTRPPAPPNIEKSVLVSSRMLSELNKIENLSKAKTKYSLRRALSALVSEENQQNDIAMDRKWSSAVAALQQQLLHSLDTELESVENSARALRALTLDTIKLQYAQLPPRYLLVLEKANTTARNPRQILMRAISIFVRIKERTLLALGLGIWKIVLEKIKSDANRIVYHKYAACHLIRNWVRDRKNKQFKQWLVLWKTRVAEDIFLQRYKAVMPIQTLYRRWRDKKIMIRMHTIRPYNGPLSDIYLGEDRAHLGVQFFIPPSIRSSRRMYWRACIKIQTCYRRYKTSQDYFKKIKQMAMLQSMLRMFPKRMKFLRLKKTTILCQSYMRGVLRRKWFIRMRIATRIAQKYVRRFLSRLLKYRMFDIKWARMEESIPASIKIQCRWRVFMARSKIRGIKYDIARKHWGALVMQRNWYRLQNCYHTFVLMCSYRARDGVDKANEKRKVFLTRFHAARIIQNHYKMHFFKRVITATVKVQCWFRGRCGYSLVHVLRKNKWAARKLHHWARGMMRKKHAYARSIQRAWWRAGYGRLRRHLMDRARLADFREVKAIREMRHTAAARMQAVLRGIWARRWVKKDAAATKIQRASRFFVSRLMWRKQIKERSLEAIRKFVGRAIGRGLISASSTLIRLHNIAVTRVQSLIRGVLLRCLFNRSRQYAFRLGLAAVTIQRFWRKSGAFMKAVQEVLALRQLDTNPFLKCDCVHNISLQLLEETRKYYSSIDPRAGMKVPIFLRRLGLYPEFSAMFPAKDFRFVSDLQRLDEERLAILYKRHLMPADEKVKNKTGAVRGAKKLTETLFDSLPQHARLGITAILNALAPKIPVSPISVVDRSAINFISAIPESISGKDLKTFIIEEFTRRFGAGYQSRAENLYTTVTTSAYGDYYNYKSVGYYVPTLSHITRAIALAKIPADVKSKIDACNSPPVVSSSLSPAGAAAAVIAILDAEMSWDLERTKICHDLLQSAVDKAIMIVRPGSILDILQKTVHTVGLFRRRMTFTLNKLRQSTPASDFDGIENASDGHKKRHKDSKKDRFRDKKLEKKADKTTSIVADEQHSEHNNEIDSELTMLLSPVESTNRKFKSSRIDEATLELYVGVCKIYMEAFNKIYVASKGIQSLKNTWQNAAMKRAVIKETLNRFLTNNTEAYFKERRDNKVLLVWKKLRRAEVIANKFNAILDARRVRLEYIDEQLLYIPRWGWEETMDDKGYSYWYQGQQIIDWKKKFAPKNSTEEVSWQYGMPKYSLKEWNAVCAIQVPMRKFVEQLMIKKREKEAAKAAEIARTDEIIKDEIRKNAGRVVYFSITLFSRRIQGTPSLSETQTENVSTAVGVDSKVDVNGNTKRSLFSKSAKTQVKHVSKGKRPPAEELSPKKDATRTVSPSQTRGKKRTKEVPKPVELTPTQLEEKFVAEAIAKYDSGIPSNTEEFELACQTRGVQLLPYRLQFEQNIAFKSGSWVLVRDENNHNIFRAAVIFHVNVKSEECSARYTFGNTVRNLPFSRIFQMALDLGTIVEARFASGLTFYRAKVIRVREFGNEKLYSLQYQDGQIEMDVSRMYIRQPSKTIDAFLTERKLYLERMVLRVKREIYYSHQRGRREVVIAAKNQFRWNNIPESLRNAPPPIQVVTAIDPELGEDEETKSENESVSSSRRPSQADPAKLSIPDPLAGYARPFRIRAKATVKYAKYPVRYGWSLIVRTNNDGVKSFSYKRMNDGYETDQLQAYGAEELYSALRIQSAMKCKLARRELCRRLYAHSMTHLIKKAISQGRKVAWIGHEFEGMTALQVLYRAGLWRIVTLTNEFYKSKSANSVNPLQSMSVETLVRIPVSQYEAKLGVVAQNDIKALRKFVEWFNDASVQDRLDGLALINSYSDEYDPRSMSECIQAAEDQLLDIFTESFPNNILRMKSIGKDIVKASLFPISRMQLDRYIETYLPKPGAAQNSIHELTNKQTTSVWIEEREVHRVYRKLCDKLHSILYYLKLKPPMKVIETAVADADKMAVMSKRKGQPQALMTSGPEAKASLILRKRVLAYILNYERNVITVQRRLRGLTYRFRWVKLKIKKENAINLILRVYRGYLHRRFARALAKEKSSDWEQLWNDKRKLMYYYNKVTLESTYNEPKVPFRPLIRDARSYALVQAWPELDRNRDVDFCAPTPDIEHAYDASGYESEAATSVWGAAGEGLGSMSTNTSIGPTADVAKINPMMCETCHARKYTRICYDCSPTANENNMWNIVSRGPAKYCFSCFTVVHAPDNPEMMNHRHEEKNFATVNSLSLTRAEDSFSVTNMSGADMGNAVDPTEPAFLVCSVCGVPATRKCMGPLDDKQIDSICNDLAKASTTEWILKLQSTELWSERRLRVLLDQIKGANVDVSATSGDHLSPAQLQEIRILLEQTRAECDDVYCATCYQDVHSGGRRTNHKWIGFLENAPVCVVCCRGAAEVQCKECADMYCNSCFKVFHSKGRKKKHAKIMLLESIPGVYNRCSMCIRRAGSVICRDCEERCCESCYDCGHKAICQPNFMLDHFNTSAVRSADSPKQKGVPKNDSTSNTENIESGGHIGDLCVLCSEPADQKCVECKDFYCSRVWMGNPGCFAVQHNKGNRAKHTIVSIHAIFDNIAQEDPAILFGVKKSKSKNMMSSSPSNNRIGSPGKR